MTEEKKVNYHNLIDKFFAGEISESEIVLLRSLLDQNPETRRIFNEGNELWQGVSDQTKLKHYNTDTGWLSVSSRLGLGEKKSRSITIISKNNFRILVAAATIACLIAIGALASRMAEKTTFQKTLAASITVTTNEGEKAHIFLADSTEITLNSGSTLQYNGQYN